MKEKNGLLDYSIYDINCCWSGTRTQEKKKKYEKQDEKQVNETAPDAQQNV